MRWTQWALLVAAVTAAPACGDDGPSGPVIDAALVAGTYNVTELTFDPAGQTVGSVNILARLTAADRPELNIATNGQFQLVFRDPTSGSISLVNGTYSRQENGIRLAFRNRTDAERLLLPQSTTLTFSQTSGTLRFTGTVSPSLSRLQQLAPEFNDPIFANQVPGDVTITFTRAAPLN